MNNAAISPEPTLIVLFLLRKGEFTPPRERSSGLGLKGFLVSAKPAFSFNLALFTVKLKECGVEGAALFMS